MSKWRFGRLLMLVAVVIVLATSASYAQMPTSADFPRNMKKYFLVLIVAGNEKPASDKEQDALKQQHLSFVRSQVEAGKFIVVGPALDDGHMRGLAIVNASTVEEAKQAWADDPFVKSGQATLEIHPVMLPDLSPVHIDYPKRERK